MAETRRKFDQHFREGAVLQVERPRAHAASRGVRRCGLPTLTARSEAPGLPALSGSPTALRCFFLGLSGSLTGVTLLFYGRLAPA